MPKARQSGDFEKPLMPSSLFPDPFPEPWAAEWGEDEFGLWMALAYQNVRQVFRWIRPGRFMMGSPASEQGSYEDETSHEVLLSRGYWLADSACTQALWRAVAGDNPGYFQEDENNPVEQVSWNDAQGFIQTLKGRVPGLNARLPSEAEWEYACRAGTETPFSFGANITPVQVNYDGNYPYAGGEKGVYREKTVPAKSLPPNPWGLYEMHGNVWEWCEDWFGDYDPGPQIDPPGPATGAARVLRGGSWIDYGRRVRSANRSRGGPGDSFRSIGFRLALGQTGPGQPAEPSGSDSPDSRKR